MSSVSSAWIQLYHHLEKQGSPEEVYSFSLEQGQKWNVGSLKGLVKERRQNDLQHCDAAKLVVYRPRTELPFSQERALNPWEQVPSDSEGRQPLIVVAPARKNEDDQTKHSTKHFRQLVELAGIDVKEAVMKVVVKYFSNQMNYTDTSELAADLYREASMIPGSMTQEELAQQQISIGKFSPEATSSKTLILEAFDCGSPCLIKVLDVENLYHEMHVWEAIEAGGGSSVHHLAPLKMLTFKRRASVQAGNMAGSCSERSDFSGGVLMQKYQSTLARCRIPLTETILLKYGYQLLTAIEKMHECGYCHLDIKPSNVFLWLGDCLLGDYGGASKPGEKVREHTPSYYPNDAGKVAKKETDFLLLAVTLLEMFGCVPSPPNPMTKNEIKSRVASVSNEKVKSFLSQLVGRDVKNL